MLQYDAAENDSLAELNVEPHLLPIWQEVRSMFPYELPPDRRAELFNEYVEEHEAEISATLADLYDVPDHVYAAEWARYEAERNDATFDVDELERQAKVEWEWVIAQDDDLAGDPYSYVAVKVTQGDVVELQRNADAEAELIAAVRNTAPATVRHLVGPEPTWVEDHLVFWD